ncbi:transcriptional regulator [Pedobacter hiemivivus]|uniref:Transcriptional regulator n=1 Tax=Pedobacter hiemivivus TaxID=2530454 RepID=A0A4R0NAJ1_9SPHI|nr:helix-turn-helix domain-containing protein [Pedobacter hiemivivus]TCC97240.1 transcriptional regulator [Pedobacter hiemivivus]TKC59229.1 transcriptional regulator [Pedobacter hiemivivus]
MKTVALKYTIIRTKSQYDDYCKQLEVLVTQDITNDLQDEIDLVTLLIEKYDEDNNTFQESDPISLLRSFMSDHHLKPQDMTIILGISKGYVSDILNYKKGLSKEVIRKLADYFKVRQEAFNRPYKLISPANIHLRNASDMNTTKDLPLVIH